MNKNNKLLKYLLLVFAGVAVGAIVFSNVEFKLSVTGPTISGRPNFATAKNTFENYPIQSLKNFNDAFVQIAESATPSVVTIFTEKKVAERGINPMDFFGHSFDGFFGHGFDDFFDKPESGSRNGRSQVQRGLGSGVIVTDDGYILTNNHVVDDADVVYIRTFDNRKIDAKLIPAGCSRCCTSFRRPRRAGILIMAGPCSDRMARCTAVPPSAAPMAPGQFSACRRAGSSPPCMPLPGATVVNPSLV